MPLPSFTITGTLLDLLGNTALGEIVGNGLGGATPATITFTSNVPAGHFVTFGGVAYRVDEVTAVVNSDGSITRNGDPVLLLANDGGLSVDGVQWQAHVAGMSRFWFNAPTDGGSVNLGSVAPVPGVSLVGLPSLDWNSVSGKPAVIATGATAAEARAAIGLLTKVLAPSGDTTGASDSAAILAAIGSGNVLVFLNPGDFYVNAAIILKNRTWLDGAGMLATRIHLANGVNASVVKNYVSPDTVVANAEFCRVSNLSIDGNKANQSAGHGIEFNSNPDGSGKATNDDDHDTHQTVENVRLYNCKQDGFNADGRSSMVLNNVYAFHCDRYGFNPTVDSALTNCVAAWSGLDGFHIGASSIQLTGCKAFYSGQVTPASGFKVYFAVGAILSGCHSQNNWAHGFALESSTGCTLAGCVSDSNSLDSAGAYVGVDLYGVLGCKISVACLTSDTSGTSYQTNALQVRNSSASNSISVSHTAINGGTVGGAVTVASALFGNLVVVNGQIRMDDGNGVAVGTHSVSNKATPADADEIPLVDTAASNVLKKLTWANLKAAISAYIVNGAPGALDTLNELAAALGNDANFATTVTNALALKASLTGTEALTHKDLTAGTNTFPTLNQNTTGSAAKWATPRNVDGQALDGTANITVIAPGTHAASSKTAPVDADEIPLVDSGASNVLKKLPISTLRDLRPSEVRPAPVLYDSFTATDGTALDSAKWTVTTGGAGAAAATTNANRGRITTGATGGYSSTDRVYVVSTVPTSLKDVEFLVRHTYGNASNESYTRYAVRSSATDPQSADSYYVELNHGNTIALSKIVSGSFTNLLSGFVTDYGCASVATGSVKWIRLRAKGTTLAFKVWDDGAPEPIAWSYTTTDSSVAAGGSVSVSMGGGSAAASGLTYFDQAHIYAL